MNHTYDFQTNNNSATTTYNRDASNIKQHKTESESDTYLTQVDYYVPLKTTQTTPKQKKFLPAHILPRRKLLAKFGHVHI